MDDLDLSDSGERDFPSDAKPRSALRKSMMKSTILRSELDRSLENTQSLNLTIRERASAIFQLSAENQRHAAELESLQAQLQSKEGQLQSILCALAAKDSQIDCLSHESAQLTGSIKLLRQRLQNMATLEGQLREEKAKIANLEIEVSNLNTLLEKKETQLDGLRRSLSLKMPRSTSILMAFAAELQAPEPNERELTSDTDRRIHQLKIERKAFLSRIQNLDEEIALLKNQPASEQVVIYNSKRMAFDEFHRKTLSQFTKQEEVSRTQRRKAEEAQKVVEKAQSAFALRKSEFEEMAATFQREKLEFEEFSRSEMERLSHFDEERSVFLGKQAEFERKIAALNDELSQLQERRAAAAAEREKIETTRQEYEEVVSQADGFEQKYSELLRDLANLEREREKFEEEQVESRELFAVKKEIEEKNRLLKSELQALEEDQQLLQKLMSDLTERRRQSDSEIEQFKAKHRELDRQEQELQAQTAKFEAQKADCERRHDQLRKEIHEFEAEKAKFLPESEAQQVINELTAKAETQRAAILKLKAKLGGKSTTKQELSMAPYSKKVCLQFFIQEASTRDSLIPVILKLIHCSDEEIQVTLRKWTESHQLLSRGFWPF
jgi:chromosome segregation ATPase